MTKEEIIRYKVFEKIIQEIKKEDIQDFIIREYFTHVINENNYVLTESRKKEMLMITSLLLGLLSAGYGGKEAAQLVDKQVESNKTIQGSTLSGTYVSSSEVQSAARKIEQTLQNYRNAAKDLNAGAETLKYLNNLKIILDKAKSSIEDYAESQGNVYLHSIYVTKVFASSPGLYRSFPKNGRYIKVNAKQRNVLFYRLVVGKVPQFIKNANAKGIEISALNQRKVRLTKAEMAENKSHPAWRNYVKDILEIKNTSGESYFAIWLDSKLSDHLKKIIGKSAKGKKKISWCAANAGYILSAFLAHNLEDLEMGKTSGSVWASTYKIYENYKNKNVLVYSQDDVDPSENEKSKISKIASVIIPGSFITTGDDEKYGTHAMIVSSVDYHNKKVVVVAGNHGNAVQKVDYDFKQIQMIVNVPELGDPNLKTGVYKLAGAVQTLPQSEQENVNDILGSLVASN